MNDSSKGQLSALRFKMIRCLEFEPEPPTDPSQFEVWCEQGHSGRPVQTHVGDTGTVYRVYEDQSVAVRFDDGDERFLLCGELEVCPFNYIIDLTSRTGNQ